MSGAAKKPACKVRMARIRLNSQGYTREGVYFGTGAPLYWVEGEDHERFFHINVRGTTRDKAKAEARRELYWLELHFSR